MRLEDAGIKGAGHETMHQRCSLAINVEDLGERENSRLIKLLNSTKQFLGGFCKKM
jgi:hypothetical protein